MRTLNQFFDPAMFRYQSNRRNAYMQRLYWEFEYCSSIHGLTLFHTLTYNNNAIPQYKGRNCFSYEDIRLVTNGALSKWLLRHHDCKYRYLVACERGEAKGKRGKDSFGLGNNPHYHLISFILPNSPSSVIPTPQQFNDKLTEIWQGSKYIDWRKAKFGHVQPGDNLGVVDSSSAFSYVSKYVCKDVAESLYEELLKHDFEVECDSYGVTYHLLYCHYKYLLSESKTIKTRQDYLDAYHIEDYFSWRKRYQLSGTKFSLFDFYEHHKPYHFDGNFLKETIFQYYNDIYKPAFVKQRLNEYRNLWSAKVRCSKSLGSYGLKFVQIDSTGVKFKIPSPSSYKVVPACNYYLRKLFFDIYKCKVTGNVLYRLNSKGIDYKVLRLEPTINGMINRIHQYLSVVYQFSDTDFLKPYYQAYPDYYPDIVRRYCIYKLVYEYRYYFSFDIIRLDDDCDMSAVKQDFRKFCEDSAFCYDYDSDSLELYLSNQMIDGTECYSFKTHPAFIEYIKFFDALDKLVEVCTDYFDTERLKTFKDKSDFIRRHKSFKFNQK